MICPCCYDPLGPAGESEKRITGARPGDLYCSRCRWLFARETIELQEKMGIDGVWQCPTHKTVHKRADVQRAEEGDVGAPP